MERTIIIKNFKFWGIHTIINSTPSFFLAYSHDWDTAEAVLAMILGIILFALFLTFITSIYASQKLLQHPVIISTIKVGTFCRLIICLSPLLLLPFALVSNQNFSPVFLLIDFFGGLLSHNIYRSIVEVLPFHISNVRLFFPTLCITLIQGCFLTLILLLIGLCLSPFNFMRKNRTNHTRQFHTRY